MQKLNRILWGVVLVAVGVVFALNALNIVDINIFFDGWWTLFIIIPCTVGLITEREKTGNLIGLLVGVFLLLCCQDILDFSMLWKLAIPAVIIIIGLKCIFGGVFGGKSDKIMAEMKADGTGVANGFAAFSGQNLNFDNEVFNGAELNAVFGGIKCDLRGAIIEKDCVINASAVFGGVDIFLPAYVNVKVRSNSIFGGVSDKKHRNSPQNTVTVYVNGSGMFGGVEIQ